jgi:hypothetical protein
MRRYGFPYVLLADVRTMHQMPLKTLPSETSTAVSASQKGFL